MSFFDFMGDGPEDLRGDSPSERARDKRYAQKQPPRPQYRFGDPRNEPPPEGYTTQDAPPVMGEITPKPPRLDDTRTPEQKYRALRIMADTGESLLKASRGNKQDTLKRIAAWREHGPLMGSQDFVARFEQAMAAAKDGSAKRLQSDLSELANDKGASPGALTMLRDFVAFNEHAVTLEDQAESILNSQELKEGLAPFAAQQKATLEGSAQPGQRAAEVKRRLADPNVGSLERSRLLEEQRKLTTVTKPLVVQPPVQEHETINGAVKGAGIPEKEFVKGIDETSKMLGVNPQDSVPFPIAFKRLLDRPEFEEVRADFEALGTTDPQMESQRLDKAEGVQAQTANQMQKEELKATMVKLAATKDIDNWAEAIAFVLLSMLIKPQMAILFFSRASERGELRAHADYLKQQLAAYDEDQKIKRERYEWNRRQAVEGQIKGQLAEEDDARQLRAEILKMQMRGQQEFAKKDDPGAELEQDFKNFMQMAAAKTANMDTEEAKNWMMRAEKILQMRAQLKASAAGVP